MKKLPSIILVTCIILTIVIFFGTKEMIYSSTPQPVQGTVTGHLTAIPFQDIDTYHIRVDSPGKIFISIKKSGLLLGTILRVLDEQGNEVLESTKLTNSSENVTIEVPVTILEDCDHIDYQIKVIATFGTGDYTLSVLKSGEMRTERLLENVAFFRLEKRANEDITLVWKDLTKEEGFLTMHLVLYDFETAEEAYEVIDVSGQIVLGNDVPAGWYSVGMVRRGESPEPLVVHITQPAMMTPLFLATSADAIPENSPSIYFKSGTLEVGQEIEYEIQFSGTEKRLWLVWDRLEGEKVEKAPLVTLKSGNIQIAAQKSKQDKIFYFPLNNPTGTYRITLKEDVRTNFELTSEFANPMESRLNLKKQVLREVFTSSEQAKSRAYDVYFKPDSTKKEVNVKLINASAEPAQYNSEYTNVVGPHVPEVAPAKQTTSFAVDFRDTTSKGFFVSVSRGTVTCEIELRDDFTLVTSDSYETHIDTLTNAIEIGDNEHVFTNLPHPSDVDYFKINIQEDSSVFFNLSHLSTSVDYNLSLLDSTGKEVWTSANPGNANEQFSRLFEEGKGGTYYLKVWSVKGFSAYKYELFYQTIYTQMILEPAGTREIVLNDLKSSDRVYLVLYSPNDTFGNAKIDSITVTEVTDNNLTNYANDIIVDFNNNGIIEANNDISVLSEERHQTNDIDNFKSKVANLSNEQHFNILNKYHPSGNKEPLDGSYPVVARKIYERGPFRIWVDTSLKDVDPELPKNIIDYISNIQLYDKIRKNFGTEPEGMTNILLTDLYIAYGGYFNAQDVEKTKDSNKMSLLYVRYAKNYSLEQYANIIAHEFQHLVYYHQTTRTGKRYVDNVEKWVDEGFACLASDIVGLGYSKKTYYQREVDKFLASPNTTTLTLWKESNRSYGECYLFARYLYDNYNKNPDISIMSSIIQSKESSNIVAIEKLTGVEFEKLYREWICTLLFNSRTDKVDIDKFDPKFKINVEIGNLNYKKLISAMTNIDFEGRGFIVLNLAPPKWDGEKDFKVFINVSSRKFRGVLIKRNGY